MGFLASGIHKQQLAFQNRRSDRLRGSRRIGRIGGNHKHTFQRQLGSLLTASNGDDHAAAVVDRDLALEIHGSNRRITGLIFHIVGGIGRLDHNTQIHRITGGFQHGNIGQLDAAAGDLHAADSLMGTLGLRGGVQIGEQGLIIAHDINTGKHHQRQQDQHDHHQNNVGDPPGLVLGILGLKDLFPCRLYIILGLCRLGCLLGLRLFLLHRLRIHRQRGHIGLGLLLLFGVHAGQLPATVMLAHIGMGKPAAFYIIIAALALGFRLGGIGVPLGRAANGALIGSIGICTAAYITNDLAHSFLRSAPFATALFS